MPVTPSAKSIEFTSQSLVGTVVSPFTGQQQTQDWNARWLEASITMPPMPESVAQAWVAFLISCRGQANVFAFPPSLAALIPPGSVPGGYWRLKANSVKWSISDGIFYGMQFEVKEALGAGSGGFEVS